MPSGPGATMAHDQTALSSYVRFYTTVVTQLESVWAAVERSHALMKRELTPFAEPLRPVESGALQAILGEPPQPPPALGALWKPQDPLHLSGLNDLYEVVGRFSFQGEDGENLGRVQEVVAIARNEIHALRSRLADLKRLPEAAMATATRLATEEGKSAEQRRAQRATNFGPKAQALQKTAKQTIEAMHAVAPPDLSDVESAADEYRKYAQKLEGVYQTCLPYLRKSVLDLYQFIGAEPASSWPDSLPLVRELPPELLAVPPADSPELQRSRSLLQGLDEEELQLGRAREDLGASIARIEGEIEALKARDAEFKGELTGASAMAEYAAANDQLLQLSQALVSYEQQKLTRQQALSEIWQRHQQIQQAIEVLDEELKNRAAEIHTLEQELEALRKDEPRLFGKDHWRSQVSSLETNIDAARAAYTQRVQEMNKLRIDHSAMSVQVQTEQQNSTLIDRWIEDAKKKREGLEKQVRELSSKLGPVKPGQAPSANQAQDRLNAIQLARAELQERTDRLRAEIRRRQEEQQQLAARIKQIDSERQRVKGMVESAQIAATQGREAALRQLAAQRRSAVDRYVSEILLNLEKSLASVDTVFIEPAREAMLRIDDPTEQSSPRVRESGEKIAPILDTLLRDLEPELLAQDAMLGQIQREFCDVAPDACRKAWAS
jgi:chromosome segregation ATPase